MLPCWKKKKRRSPSAVCIPHFKKLVRRCEDDVPLVSSGSTMGGMRSGSSSSPACSPVARIRLRSRKSGTSMAKSADKRSHYKKKTRLLMSASITWWLKHKVIIFLWLQALIGCFTRCHTAGDRGQKVKSWKVAECLSYVKKKKNCRCFA